MSSCDNFPRPMQMNARKGMSFNMAATISGVIASDAVDGSELAIMLPIVWPKECMTSVRSDAA